MGKYKDITGQKFGRWTVIEYAGKSKYGAYMWKCQCECGTVRNVVGGTLRMGISKSCGCINKEIPHDHYKTHGGKNDRLYGVWRGIKTRCYNSNDKAYKWYGGRGIKMCDEWKNNYQSFKDWAIETGYNPDAKKYECTIDRIDDDGDYSPDNCRWVNQIVQSNNRLSNHTIEYNGEVHTITQWSKITGIRKDTLRRRIVVYGWSIERALTEPVHHK